MILTQDSGQSSHQATAMPEFPLLYQNDWRSIWTMNTIGSYGCTYFYTFTWYAPIRLIHGQGHLGDCLEPAAPVLTNHFFEAGQGEHIAIIERKCE